MNFSRNQIQNSRRVVNTFTSCCVLFTAWTSSNPAMGLPKSGVPVADLQDFDDAMEDLMGPDLALWSTVLFIKESRSNQYVSWHQDASYMGLDPHDFATPWLALTPSNNFNGCMSMIPGSHIDEIHQHQDTFDDDNILTRGQVIKDVDESSAVDLILRPGQMSIHHARTVHGSRPNQSKDRRIGIAMQAYMAPHVQQSIVDNCWLPVRGDNTREGAVELHRPRYDMDHIGVADRKMANKNLSRILYHGADRKRAY